MHQHNPMKRNPLIIAAALQLILVLSAFGQWTPADNFSVLNPGDIKGQNGWGGDATIVANVAAGPVDPGNQTLAYTSTGGNGNVYKTALGIEDDGSTGTVFMRVYIAGNSDPDAPFGLAVSDTPDWGSTDLGGNSAPMAPMRPSRPIRTDGRPPSSMAPGTRCGWWRAIPQARAANR